MITVEKWLSEPSLLKDEIFEPAIIVGHKVNGRIVKYVGTETGTELSPDFCDVLEG
jgi:hypothetical protein